MIERFWLYFLTFLCKTMTTIFWITFCVYLIVFSPHRLCGKFQLFVYRFIINIASYLIYCIINHYVCCFSCWWQIKALLRTLDHLDKAHVFKPNNAFIFKTHGNIIYECWKIVKKISRTSTTFMFLNQTMYSL